MAAISRRRPKKFDCADPFSGSFATRAPAIYRFVDRETKVVKYSGETSDFYTRLWHTLERESSIRTRLGGHLKTGHTWTGQNRP